MLHGNADQSKILLRGIFGLHVPGVKFQIEDYCGNRQSGNRQKKLFFDKTNKLDKIILKKRNQKSIVVIRIMS